uniref:Secreted peptide n=1 Tax=Anopheles braziliensis TaxID=58242 RepID=A0A2M3ZLF9_9DIPT
MFGVCLYVCVCMYVCRLSLCTTGEPRRCTLLASSRPFSVGFTITLELYIPPVRELFKSMRASSLARRRFPFVEYRKNQACFLRAKNIVTCVSHS